VLGNHDQPRITSRVGIEQARVAAMLLLTLRGTPTIYYGEEIGMRDVPIPLLKYRILRD
jgi:alpha-glucosidase